jgi:hypothetical protein
VCRAVSPEEGAPTLIGGEQVSVGRFPTLFMDATRRDDADAMVRRSQDRLERSRQAGKSRIATRFALACALFKQRHIGSMAATRGEPPLSDGT